MFNAGQAWLLNGKYAGEPCPRNAVYAVELACEEKRESVRFQRQGINIPSVRIRVLIKPDSTELRIHASVQIQSEQTSREIAHGIIRNTCTVDSSVPPIREGAYILQRGRKTIIWTAI